MAVFFATLLSLAGASVLLFIYNLDHELMGEKHIEFLGWTSFACLVLVTITSFLISRFVVTGFNHISRTAESIMTTGDLSQRISIDSKWDDLSYLSQTLNQMIGRIETLVETVRRVSDNIAHDLRTPLTRLRHRLEDGAQGANPEQEKYFRELMEETDHVLNTFNALLRIARIEAQHCSSNSSVPITDVDLRQLTEDVISFYQPLSEEKNIQLDVHLESFPIRGDRDLLFQALANILDNAIKFTPAGGQIWIRLENRTLSVTDSGPGVPDADQKKIFERFFRSETCRTTPGSGLGLSLVSAVAQFHNLDVQVKNTISGFQINLTWPTA